MRTSAPTLGCEKPFRQARVGQALILEAADGEELGRFQMPRGLLQCADIRRRLNGACRALAATPNPTEWSRLADLLAGHGGSIAPALARRLGTPNLTTPRGASPEENTATAP